jgi:perosamine synthetase
MTSSKFIPIARPMLTGKEGAYVQECVETGWVSSLGRFVPLFEERFAEFCGVEYAIACNSGTSALHLALLGLGVGAGDEVIVPTLTYVASANAVRYCNATPVFVDSDARTMNLDPAQVEHKITPKTRAIIAVHLYGHPADMDALRDIGARHGIPVIEDAAEAHGALCRGQRVGGIGDVAAFSFFGNKIITTGEGGMVLTRDPELAGRIRILKGQGMDPERRYWFPIVGYNYRMTNVAAALGVAQLEAVEQHLAARRRVAEWYDRHLRGLEAWLRLPVEEPWARHAYWLYTVLLKPPAAGRRDECITHLAARGIETRPVFHPMHLLPPYREPAGRYPIAECLGRSGISLPSHGFVTEDDVIYVAGCLEAWCREAAPGLHAGNA